MFRVDNLIESGFGEIEESGHPIFPSLQRLSREAMFTNCIYVIDTCTFIFVWIGNDVADETLDELFTPEERETMPVYSKKQY